MNEPGLPVWQQIGDFIIHLVPSFILTGILLPAWKRGLAGGLLFTALALGSSPFLYNLNYNRTQLVATTLGIVLLIVLPILLTGLLS